MQKIKFAIKTFIIFIGILLFLPLSASAILITIDFNDLSNGTIVSDQYLSQGVIFSGHDYGSDNSGFSPPDISVGSDGGVTLNSYCNGGGYIRADFSTLVDFVSVDFTLFEGDSQLDLELYDTSGNSLSASTYAGLDGITHNLMAQTVSPNVAYAIFYGHGADDINGINAVINDNFTFGTTAPVPEPATMMLFGIGLLGLAGVSRRRK